ncbi:MAG: TVP38/TMEM64 family protein, partial [Opitutaceae bacterium]
PPLGGIALLSVLTWSGGWLRLHPEIGWFVYAAGAVLLIGLSVVPTFSCAIIAGWAFGFLAGVVISVVAVTAGAVLAYAIGRGIAKDRVVELVREHPRLDAVHRALLARRAGETLLVVVLVRLPPAAPFGLTNFLLAAARVPLPDYIVGTLVGVIPRLALTAFVGAALEQLRFDNVMDRWMVVAGGAVSLLAVIALGVLAGRALRRVAARTAP